LEIVAVARDKRGIHPRYHCDARFRIPMSPRRLTGGIHKARGNIGEDAFVVGSRRVRMKLMVQHRCRYQKVDGSPKQKKSHGQCGRPQLAIRGGTSGAAHARTFK